MCVHVGMSIPGLLARSWPAIAARRQPSGQRFARQCADRTERSTCLFPGRYRLAMQRENIYYLTSGRQPSIYQ